MLMMLVQTQFISTWTVDTMELTLYSYTNLTDSKALLYWPTMMLCSLIRTGKAFKTCNRV